MGRKMDRQKIELLLAIFPLVLQIWSLTLIIHIHAGTHWSVGHCFYLQPRVLRMEHKSLQQCVCQLYVHYEKTSRTLTGFHWCFPWQIVTEKKKVIKIWKIWINSFSVDRGKKKKKAYFQSTCGIQKDWFLGNSLGIHRAGQEIIIQKIF